MAKVIVYHAINEEEKEILIDIHEIQNECIRQMKKEYPKYKIEIVDDHAIQKGNMKLKDFNTEEHFKQSFKKVFGEDIDISLDTTFGELAEMQRLILEKAENQESQ